MACYCEEVWIQWQNLNFLAGSLIEQKPPENLEVCFRTPKNVAQRSEVFIQPGICFSYETGKKQ